MHTAREQLARPAWTGDRLDSPSPPEIEDAYFDEVLDAWVLSRHADILAAFRAPELSPTGPHRKNEGEAPSVPNQLKMREEAMEAFDPSLLSAWRELLTGEADVLVMRLPREHPVDVMEEYARPLCLILASMVTGIDLGDAMRLRKSAQLVSAAAAEPYDPALHSRAASANAELKSCFHSGPVALRDSGFVALSQTLPGILGNAWFGLLQHPGEWRLLHRQPELMDQAIEELLRYAGLVRVLFRMATQDLVLNGCRIHKGQRVVLRIVAANRDPERFPHANSVDITRRGAGHLALGAGPHSCVGASLIRMGAVAISRPMLARFATADLARPVMWHGGSIFRSPSSLWVRLQTTQQG